MLVELPKQWPFPLPSWEEGRLGGETQPRGIAMNLSFALQRPPSRACLSWVISHSYRPDFGLLAGLGFHYCPHGLDQHHRRLSRTYGSRIARAAHQGRARRRNATVAEGAYRSRVCRRDRAGDRLRARLSLRLVASARMGFGVRKCPRGARAHDRPPGLAREQLRFRTIEKMEGQKVISTGPYALVRHPMYVGVLIMFIGVPLALGSYRACSSCCSTRRS